MTHSRLTLLAVIAVFAGSLLVVVPIATARPPDPPPKVSGTPVSPPPAWFTLRSRDRWFAFSSYCWKTACVDMIPPQMRPDVPRARARLGERLTIQLAFRPTSLEIMRIGASGVVRAWRLPAERVTTWKIGSLDALVVAAKSPSGSASYVVRLVKG